MGKRSAKKRQQQAEARRNVKAKTGEITAAEKAEKNPFNVREQRRKHSVLGQTVRAATGPGWSSCGGDGAS